ncbi:MAG: chemotaxis protein CheC [Methanobacteriota archaeon]|nr:MAG: chemotaxis protein CheC [Euryarchaeota archaeon]
MQEEDAGKALEIISEFANVGAGNAATALASLLDIELVNEVTSCKLLPIADMGEWLGGNEQVVAGMYTQLCGDLRSGVLVIFPEASANTLVRHMSQEEADLSNLSKLQMSALCEAGNICLCWYLVAVSKMIDTDLVPAPPGAAVDLLGAVLDIPLATLGTSVDRVIAVHTIFRGVDRIFEGYFLLLPEGETLDVIMKKVGDIPK